MAIREVGTLVDVARVEDVVAIVVVGDAWFPPPLEHEATRRVKAATNANTENRFGTIVLSMTLAMLGRFPERASGAPQPVAPTTRASWRSADSSLNHLVVGWTTMAPLTTERQW